MSGVAGQRAVRTPLSRICRVQNGFAFDGESFSIEGGMPLIRIRDLKTHAPSIRYTGSYDGEYIVRSGDLLVGMDGEFRCYIWGGSDALLNQRVSRLLPDKTQLDGWYLYYAIDEYLRKIEAQTTFTTVKHLSSRDIEAIQIPIPPLAEQERIAGRLRRQMAEVERARAASAERFVAAQALPTAYLREVFERPEARAWKRQPVKALCDLLPSKSIATNGDTLVQAITTACLSERGFRPDGLKTARMWGADAAEAAVRNGEVLVARSNTPELVGRVSMYEGLPANVVASDLTIRLWARGGDDGVSAAYLSAYLSYLFQTGYWRQRAGGASGTMKKITREQISAETIPFPPIADQKRIAADLSRRLAEAERLAGRLREELATVEALPAALLREAFGETLAEGITNGQGAK